jgi:hypothetical protein
MSRLLLLDGTGRLPGVRSLPTSGTRSSDRSVEHDAAARSSMRYHPGVFMYDPSLQPVVLAKLDKWERLTESDLNAMLRPEDRLRLREDLLQDMAHSGLITMRVIGDEPVLTITDAGREWLRKHEGRR